MQYLHCQLSVIVMFVRSNERRIENRLVRGEKKKREEEEEEEEEQEEAEERKTEKTEGTGEYRGMC